MTCQNISQPNTTALDRLVRRVDETIAQCRRFEKMAAVATTWAHKWPTSTLERWLNAEDSSQLDREIGLVALALSATAEAGRILESYDPTAFDHKLFYDVVWFEWKQRHRDKATHRRVA